jgi:signal transduction histidine kinase
VIVIHPERAGRPLRPRTLAVLAEVADQLSQSMATQLALDRLGQMDDAVARLDRLAALGGLVTEIVHEIRNPLVAVKTFLQLLPERQNDPEFHNGFRNLVGEEVQRLERMLDDLLRHARPRSTPSIGEGAHIAEAVETALQLVSYRCRERGIELATRIRPELPALGLAPDALRQLLLNLLLNATQVTPRGGSIRLHADWSPEFANHLVLSVEDDGPGVAPELAARIFEPFWTRRSDGAGGLGLAICKRIVEDAGGSISVQSGSNGGARLRVDLPIDR